MHVPRHSLVHPQAVPPTPPASPHPTLPQSMGYQMNSRPRPAKPAPKPAAQAQAAQAVMVAPAPAPERFQDVVEASEVIEPVSPKQLLAGTELEKSPERRGRPVAVVKPGMAAPAGAQASTAMVATAQAAPRPVAVVKPQKRSSIGDMLRGAAASMGGGGGAYEQPRAGTVASYNGSGYAEVLTRPAPEQQGQASFPAAGFPVNTGSPAAMAAAAAQPVDPAAGTMVPVQYNPDGSVVLSSKPIKVLEKRAALWVLACSSAGRCRQAAGEVSRSSLCSTIPPAAGQARASAAQDCRL